MDTGDVLQFIVAAVLVIMAYLMGRITAAAKFKLREREIRADTARRQRAVVGGQVSEQLAPYFPDFPLNPSEARFIGKPVDFIVFPGMDDKKIEKVVFVEVKTGSSRLSAQERHLRDAIEDGRVEWLVYRREDSPSGEIE
jgi:predicted Holliday junction resolvase-like endonuclease